MVAFRITRVGRLAFIVAVAAASALGGGAVSLAFGGEDRASDARHGHGTGAHTNVPSADTQGPPVSTARPGAGRHHHGSKLPPYSERYADATTEARDAADALLADVRSTLANFASADAAVAAGYRAPAMPRGALVHYRNPAVARGGPALDPTQPAGLVYFTVDGTAPVLLGAFFVVPPGTPAPEPADELVVWHSHDPTCPSFFVSADEPCANMRRMLHVWTFDEVTLLSPRTAQPIAVRVTDPFGVPFRAAVERAS